MSKIFVQDDFFPEKELNIIKTEMLNVEYTPPPEKNVKFFQGIYWHNHHLPQFCEVKDLIQSLIKKYFYYKVKRKTHSSLYTMVGTTDKPRPHLDKVDVQCLIYVIGDNKLNNGTGFYKKTKEGDYSLHSHIGFKENRAIFFTSDNMHAPLHWAAKEGESSWRYSICNFFAQ